MARVRVDRGCETRFFGVVILVIDWIVGIVLPGLTGLVEAVPVVLPRFFEIVEAGIRIAFEGPGVVVVAAGHSAADVVAANRMQQVQMRFDIGDLEQIVLDSAP